MSLLEAQALTYAYPNGRLAVDDFSLTADRGEIVALIGPNGAGKSTVLQLLSGHLRWDSGKVTLDGRDLSGLRSSERAHLVTLVPQAAGGPMDLTVGETVGLGRLAHQTLADRFLLRPQRDADGKAVARALSDTDLTTLRSRIARQLSGGERERVRIAMAFAQETALLCLDEPSAHMDPGHAVDVMERLRRRAREGTAVVVALHDLNLASVWATRLLLMAEGRLVAKGTAEEVLTPQNVFEVFGRRLTLGQHPASGRPVIFPD